MSSDPFIEQLRNECLRDTDDNFGAMRAALMLTTGDPVGAVRGLMKACHTVKGNLQAVGLLICARYVHDLESVFILVNEAVSRTSVDLFTLGRLEYLASDSVEHLQTWFNDLLGGQAETEDQYASRSSALEMLRQWAVEILPELENGPTGAVSISVPEESPAVLETAGDDFFESIQTAETEHQATSSPVSDIQSRAAATETESKTTPEGALSSTERANDPVSAPIIESAAEPRSEAAQAAPLESDSREEDMEGQYLLCRTGPQLFAIPIGQVMEVIQDQQLSPLPYTRQDIVGILNYRGEPLPILSCQDLKMHERDEAGAGYIVIAHFDGRTFGFKVDQALSVSVLDRTQFERPQSLLLSAIVSWVEFLGHYEDETIFIMDLQRALAA